MFIPLRDENPGGRFPIVTLFLVTLNTALFLASVFSEKGLEYFALTYGAIPFEISHFVSLPGSVPLAPPLTLFTSMFLHGSFFHLAGNMLYLWIFGNNIEESLGAVKFLLFYVASGLAAGLSQVAFSPNSQIPMIGASGAIAGVLGAYFILYPHARVQTLVFLFIYIRVVPIPAAVLLGIWFLMQLLNVGMGGGVAWFAHLGGFLAGVVLIKWLAGKPRWRRS
ncbi:MAG TPA: rhomboid family intramembrane serine protease [Candidatus Aminicenantes bacterium]|nr:rhomboid family intramembrane serine protease [Candidatus Aminicenantes bacterium]